MLGIRANCSFYNISTVATYALHVFGMFGALNLHSGLDGLEMLDNGLEVLDDGLDDGLECLTVSISDIRKLYLGLIHLADPSSTECS